MSSGCVVPEVVTVCAAPGIAEPVFKSTGDGDEMRFFRRRRSNYQDNCSVVYGPKGHSRKVSVVARWDFDVVDPDKVIAAVISRLVDKGYDAEDAAAHVRDVEQALLMLFELDGWEPKYEPIGLEFAGSDATVRAISRTLADGDDDAIDDEF